VRHFADTPPRFVDLQNLSAFILFAAIAAPCIVAALLGYYFFISGGVADFWMAWRLRFLANVFATLAITPLIVLTVADGMAAIRGASLRRCAEFGLILVGLVAIGLPVFSTDTAGPQHYPALLFAPLPFLVWASVRFGPGGICLTLLVVAFLALSNTVAGRGPFASHAEVMNILSLQIFLIAISLPLMLLAALVDERREKTEALRWNEAALRASYKQIQSLVGRLITAQEAERTRIARELHDDINQEVAALAIGLSSLKRQLPADADVDVALARLQQRTMALADELRHLSHELHPGVLQHAGLVAALKAHCTEFGDQHAIKVTLATGAGLDVIPQDIALCLYRVTQEAMRNIAEHAAAHQACVTLRRTADGLELIIADDGQGFDLAEARRRDGLGLISLDERVRLVGGSLRISTQWLRGTELRVQVPLKGREHAPHDHTSRR
jgi:two-component system sensor histidine kinase UhpB